MFLKIANRFLSYFFTILYVLAPLEFSILIK
jgi:hypothetical protein